MRRKLIVEVVDDDQFFCRILQYQISGSGFICRVSHSPEALFSRLESETLPDIFVLDMDFGSGRKSGLEVCRWVTDSCQRPVMMVTADDRTESVVACLEAGAQQYMIKPCNPRELRARLQVMARMLPGDLKQGNILSMASVGMPGICIDLVRRCMFSATGGQVVLTEKELELLQLFRASNDGTVNRHSAFRILYGFDMDPTNRSIDVLISRLRKKFKQVMPKARIHTVRGEGYLLVDEGREVSVST